MLPGFCARQPTQHEQFAFAAQAFTSEQQLCLAHVVHAVSLGAGGHMLPPLPVVAALELALVEAAELLPIPVHSA